jgi:hypothetical protein
MKPILQYQMLTAVWIIAMVAVFYMANAARMYPGLLLLMDICALFAVLNFLALMAQSFIFVVSWFNPREKVSIP